jgi:Vitamin K-dependent gamma-carboxylase
MTSRQLLDRWLKFWFAPNSPTPVCLFRLVFASLILDAALIHIGPDVLDWYGPYGVTSADAVHRYWWLNEPRFDLFLLGPNTETSVMFFWYIFVAAVVCLLIGFKTRASAIVVTLFLISMDNRQPFAINGGDAMMRILAGYLIFAESGAAFSVDRLITRWKRPTFGQDSVPKPVAPWGQRMIQVQMSLTYWSTICAKVGGAQWLDGTAVYYATRLDDMINHPLPLYDSLLFCKFLTYYTIFVEASMFSLVWFRDLRYYVLGATMIMHIGIDYSINLPIFEWIFMTSFITFIYPEDLTRCMDFVKKRIDSFFGPAADLHYNPLVPRETSLASVLEGLDVFGRLNILPVDGAVLSAQTSQGRIIGIDLFAFLTGRLPLLWPLFPFIKVPRLLAQAKPKTPAVKQEAPDGGANDDPDSAPVSTDSPDCLEPEKSNI